MWSIRSLKKHKKWSKKSTGTGIFILKVSKMQGYKIKIYSCLLTLKRLREGGGQIDPRFWFFQKCVFQRKGEALLLSDF